MSETQNNHQAAEDISNLLHELFKAAGVSMISVEGHEQIRTIAQKLAETVEYHAEWKAVDVSKALQEAVKSGFEGVEQELVEQKIETGTKILHLTKDFNKVIEDLIDQKRRFDTLGQAFLTLEKETKQMLIDLKKETQAAFLDQKEELEKRVLASIQKLQQETSHPLGYKTREGDLNA